MLSATAFANRYAVQRTMSISGPAPCFSPQRIRAFRHFNSVLAGFRTSTSNSKWSHVAGTRSPRRSELAAASVAPQSPSIGLRFELLADCADADLAAELQEPVRGYRTLISSESFSRIHAVDVPITSTLCVCTAPNAAGSWFQEYITAWQDHHGPIPPLLFQFLQDNSESEFVRLCIFLLWVRDMDLELWTRYTGLLPAYKDLCCLLNYTQEEALELQIQSLQEEAEKQKEVLRDVGLRLLNKKTGFLRSLNLPDSLEDFLWAAGVVQSRSVYWQLNGAEVMMLPTVADFVNHSFQPNCEIHLTTDSQRVQVSPLRPISEGEEITIAYLQQATNGDLMRNYGFVLPGNVYDVLDFQGVDLAGVKLRGELLARAVDARGHFYNNTLAVGTGTAATRGEQVRRNRTRSALMSLPVVEDVGAILQAGDTAAPVPNLSSDELGLQRQAAQSLRDACQRMLWGLGTSLETDQQMLQSAKSLALAPRMQVAIQCRMEHKEVLQEVLTVLDTYLQYLRSKQTA